MWKSWVFVKIENINTHKIYLTNWAANNNFTEIYKLISKPKIKFYLNKIDF